MHRITRVLSHAHRLISEVADELPANTADGQRAREILAMLEWMQDRTYVGRRLPDALLSLMTH
jgi:hypothetical protein